MVALCPYDGVGLVLQPDGSVLCPRCGYHTGPIGGTHGRVQ
jgi:uncharacterized Zn finger protein (UPF0148 family)